MNSPSIVNASAVVRNKLQDLARTEKKPFSEILQYYGMERFLYRLSISRHSKKFVLKGGLMFTAWTIENRRITMDIDMLARANNDVEAIRTIVQEICFVQPHVEDGSVFDPESVTGKKTQVMLEYSGVQLRFEGALHKAPIPMKMDIGFSDSVYPQPESISYPTLLDFPSPKLNGYTPESLIAEKFQTIVIRGVQNSRMKDFFDLWNLLNQKEFQGEILLQALKETFSNRNTPLTIKNLEKIQNLGNIQAKKIQWEQFLRKNKIGIKALDLHVVISAIASFLGPLIEACEKKQIPPLKWNPRDRWAQ